MKIAAIIALTYFILAGWLFLPLERDGLGLLKALRGLLSAVVIILWFRVRAFSRQMAEYRKPAGKQRAGNRPSLDL